MKLDSSRDVFLVHTMSDRLLDDTKPLWVFLFIIGDSSRELVQIKHGQELGFTRKGSYGLGRHLIDVIPDLIDFKGSLFQKSGVRIPDFKADRFQDR